MEVYLHIGKIKTGTTSIQNFLCTNKDILRQYSAYYGDYVTFSGLSPAHFNFFYAAMKDLFILLGYPEIAQKRLPHARPLFSWLTQSIDNAKSQGCTKLLLSCENFSQWTSFPKIVLEEYGKTVDINDLYRGMREIFANVIKKFAINLKFIVFLRNQVDLFKSSYNQAVKGGFFFDSLEHYCVQQMHDPDNNDLRLLSTLEEIVPRENILVRRFVKNACNDALIVSFLDMILDSYQKEAFAAVPDKNVSLSRELIEFRRFLGKYLPERETRTDIFYEFIFEEFQQQHKEYCSQIIMPDTLKNAIRSHFSEMNAAIAERYFSGNKELYPDEGSHDALSSADEPEMDAGQLGKMTCQFIAFLSRRKHTIPQT
jgi:hypothetical protein